MHRSRRKCRKAGAYGGRRRYRRHFAQPLGMRVAGSDACAQRPRFFKNGKWTPKWKRYHPHIVQLLACCVLTTYIFFIFQNLEEIDSCARESTTGTTLSSSAIGTLQGMGRDGSNFLETAKMCGLSSDASLPAARCAGGSVFILFRKRCTGGKMENGGFWRQASLPPTLCVAAGHVCCR